MAKFLPSTPGISFLEMRELVESNNVARERGYSDQLLIAIFWEETMFNNIRQPSGNAVGYGQVEFEKGNTERARRHGVSLMREMSDDDSVKAAAAVLFELDVMLKSKAAVLNAYGGVFWAEAHPDARPTADERRTIIRGWEACETALKVIPFLSRQNVSGVEDSIMGALRKSRGFANPPSDPFRSRLFPWRKQSPRAFPAMPAQSGPRRPV